MIYQYDHVFSLATMLSLFSSEGLIVIIIIINIIIIIIIIKKVIIALSGTVKREIKELVFLHIKASKFKRSLSTYYSTSTFDLHCASHYQHTIVLVHLTCTVHLIINIL